MGSFFFFKNNSARPWRVQSAGLGSGGWFCTAENEAKNLSGVFDRFYGGSGLGLAISRAFVEAHGGRIDEYSRLSNCDSFSGQSREMMYDCPEMSVYIKNRG